MADLFSNITNPISKANTGGWTVNAGGGAYIDDWVTIGVNGGIFQGTGTPASPTTALKIYNSSGIGLVEMWKAGVKTFYFDTNGDVTLSGTITASAGSIGGWTIGSGLLSAGSGSDAVGLAPGTYPFYAGNATPADAPFSVSKAGAIKATSGTIGGWTLASAYLADAGGTCGLAPADYPFYAGDTYANRASAEFRVSTAGALTATNATLTGSLSTASGSVLLNANGATVVVPETTWNPVNAFRLGVTETDVLARLEGYWTGGLHSASYARFEVDYGDYATLYLTADASFEGAVVARAESGASYSAQITASSIATPFVINQVGISICDAVVGVFDADGLAITGHITATQHITSSVATGAPFSSTSTDVCTNVNADMLDGYHAAASLVTNAILKFDGSDIDESMLSDDGNTVTINQGAFDYNILRFQNTDVAHGVTTVAPTDVYGYFQPVSPTAGGCGMRGISSNVDAITLWATYTNDNTTKSTSGDAPITFQALKKSGTGQTNMGADANLARFVAYATTVWIVDEDGDTWQNGSVTAVGGFGCNSKAAQTAYALDAAISGTADGTYNATEQGLINSLVSQVNKLRAALVANGICS